MRQKKNTPQVDDSQKFTATLDLHGATCTSCSIAIEHIGRRLPAVHEIYVDRATSTIHVTYSQEAVLENICAFVRQLGYEASVRTSGTPYVSDTE